MEKANEDRFFEDDLQPPLEVNNENASYDWENTLRVKRLLS